VSTLSDDILVSLSALLDRSGTQFRHRVGITTPLNEVARLGLAIRIYKNVEQIKAADRLASFALHSGHRSLDYLLELRLSGWLWILDGLMKSRLINDHFRQFGPQLINSDSMLFQVRGERPRFHQVQEQTFRRDLGVSPLNSSHTGTVYDSLQLAGIEACRPHGSNVRSEARCA
jgi:hypothetical protein